MGTSRLATVATVTGTMRSALAAAAGPPAGALARARTSHASAPTARITTIAMIHRALLAAGFLVPSCSVGGPAFWKSQDGDLIEFEVRTKDRRDPRESLASKLIAKGWAVRRLELRKVNLDALFNEVVRNRYAAAEPAPEAPAPSLPPLEPTNTPAA